MNRVCTFQAARAIRWDGDAVIFLKRRYRLWLSRPLDGELRCGSFNEDARGRWYLNLQVEIPEDREMGPARSVSTWASSPWQRSLQARRSSPAPLPQVRASARRCTACRAQAPRSSHPRQDHEPSETLPARALHPARAGEPAHLRRQHKFLWACQNQPGEVRTRCRLVAARSQLHYKAIKHGAEYLEIDERLTTQVCSACGARGGPKGREDLVVRDWICGGCGASHDRDINSAINILVLGRNVGLQETEIPSLQGGEDVKPLTWPQREPRAALRPRR